MTSSLSRLAAASLLLISMPLFAQVPSGDASYEEWWKVGYPRPLDAANAKTLPLIGVDGNRFVDPDGETVLFRGLSIADPDKVEKQGQWNAALFQELKEMGVMLVRLPVHPISWRTRGPKDYLALLDQAVQWATDAGMYLIIDWHSIGNLKMELFQHPMYDTTHRETFQFWRTIAHRYAGHNTVAFYEIFNEPTTFRNQLGSVSWDEWKEINEDIIRLIRAFDEETIPLVAPFDWAYDLTPLHIEPIAAERIGYVTHPYPFKRSPPWAPKWDEDFGFAAGRFPVIATEMGFGHPGEDEPIGPEHYGPVIINYLEERGISWVGWCYDPDWGPALLKSWEPRELTVPGEFFRSALRGEVQVGH